MFRGERDACPLPLAKKDGVYLPVETRIWFGKWSGMDCIFGLSKDLSKEQAALQKFNRLFNSNPAPMAVSSFPERKFTDVNDAFVSTLGFSREEVIGKTNEELGLFVEPEVMDQQALGLQDEGSVRNVEMKVRKKDGTIADGLFFAEIVDNQGRESLLSLMIDITARKHLEREVKQAAEQFRTVADFTYDWEYWIAPDGSLAYVSPSCERITGYCAEEFINNPGLIQEIVNSEDRSLMNDHLASIDSGPPHKCEFRIVSRSGETHWIGHVCQAVYSVEGKWLGRRVNNRDITPRKRAEELLKIASAYNRSLIEISPDPLVTISVEGKITDVNTATERFTGCSRDELIGTDFSDYFTDPEKARSGYQQVFRDGTVKDYELALRHKNGEVISVLYNASVYHDESGKVAGIFAAARDITNLKEAERKLMELNEELERKIAERTMELTAANRQLLSEIQEHADTACSLRDSEKSVKTVIESSPIGIFVIQNEEYTFANQAFIKIFGLTDSSDVIGKPPETPYGDDSGKRIRDILWRCVDKSVMINVNELKALTQDQRERRLNLWLQPTEFWGSSAVMGFIIDVSDELELRAHLNQAQKMEALGSLAGGIAHDFNNVLFAITGYTELALSSAPAGSKLNGQLEQVLGAAGRAAELVKHILTFSRERDQEKKPLIIGPIVKESLSFLRASITQNIEIRRNISANLHTVNGDPTQIHQIIMNLVTNAYHAMKNTGGVLGVSLDEVDLTPDFVKARPGMLPGTYQRLMVSDTGHGMNPETLKRIFDPYFTTKEVGQGTGLGLSVVDSVIREHGGAITVQSVPDDGTTFEVYFPIMLEEKTSSEETEEVAPLGSGRILFVDDETMVTEVTRSNLESFGYEVIIENDPLSALARFEAEPYSFDLVITDMSMPKMTGLQLSIKISQIRKDIPIILITGFSDLLDDQSLLEYGILELIRKPIRKVILAQAISRILTKQDN
jgi:PAS domain S-box-containing protein